MPKPTPSALPAPAVRAAAEVLCGTATPCDPHTREATRALRAALPALTAEMDRLIRELDALTEVTTDAANRVGTLTATVNAERAQNALLRRQLADALTAGGSR
ncbi:hypothetical protein [Nocardiopsis synnemataformans]|uniref:hypothetical protein n=1 Tax=Nocardiopsis synnemataformans TaxID=61305 RepID=UPI003EBA206F